MNSFKITMYIVAILGIEFGSFANVCIYRWPKGQSVKNPRRSFCPWCKIKISWYDNFPILSFFLLGTRCRNCHSSISCRYPTVELILPILWMGLNFINPIILGGDKIVFMLGLFYLCFVLLVTTVTDIDWRIIPDQASYGLILIGFLISPINHLLGASAEERLLSCTMGVLSCGGLSLAISVGGAKILGREVLGLGDVKLLAGFGAFLGWEGALFAFVLASLIGGMFSGGGLLLKVIKRHQYIPFGPFLNLAAYITLLVMLNSPTGNYFWRKIIFSN